MTGRTAAWQHSTPINGTRNLDVSDFIMGQNEANCEVLCAERHDVMEDVRGGGGEARVSGGLATGILATVSQPIKSKKNATTPIRDRAE